MNKFNGIIIDGEVYVAVPRGSLHCSDCDLFKQCKKDPANYGRLCVSGVISERVIFCHSQTLTDKFQQ